MREASLRAPVLAHLRSQGYAAWADPDGRDYFDVAAVRGEEVGLVELKVADSKAVFAQALRRRAWADWVAVAVPGIRSARRLAGVVDPPLAARVGVWRAGPAGVEVLRPARALKEPGEEDPFDDSRARLRALLTAMERGEVPEGIGWGIFGAPRLASGGRRSTADYRLEEFR